MISKVGPTADSFDHDRLLVVGDCFGGTWVDELRSSYSEWRIATSPSYLSGIAELARRPARAVLACVDPSLTQLDNAVAGLREAAGPDTKLILCCTPEFEPVTRRVLAGGADDYVLYPLESEALDAAIGYTRVSTATAPMLTAVPAASMEELGQLSEALAGINEKPMVLVQRIASLIRIALSARARRLSWKVLWARRGMS